MICVFMLACAGVLRYVMKSGRGRRVGGAYGVAFAVMNEWVNDMPGGGGVSAL